MRHSWLSFKPYAFIIFEVVNVEYSLSLCAINCCMLRRNWLVWSSSLVRQMISVDKPYECHWATIVAWPKYSNPDYYSYELGSFFIVYFALSASTHYFPSLLFSNILMPSNHCPLCGIINVNNRENTCTKWHIESHWQNYLTIQSVAAESRIRNIFYRLEWEMRKLQKKKTNTNNNS